MDKQWLVDLLFQCQNGYISCRAMADIIIKEHDKLVEEQRENDRRPTEVAQTYKLWLHESQVF